MKRSKTPLHSAKNISKLHKHIGKLLTESKYLSNFEIRQEYPVSWVNKDFPSNRERFDWVVLGIKVCIEVMGVQHYMAIPFGGITMEEARRNFRKQLNRDILKEKAANDAGWAYITVKYTEHDITEEELHNRITEALKAVTENKEERRLHKIVTGAKRQKAKYVRKIPSRPIQTKTKYDWPTKKLPSRPFPKREQQ